MKQDSIHLLVCDLDNTLYEWFVCYTTAYDEMLDAASRILGCDREQLVVEIKKVHQHHHDSEYPFALLETDTMSATFPGYTKQALYQQFRPIFSQFSARKRSMLRLYPHVYETLEKIQAANIPIVAYTESHLYSVIHKLDYLKITHFFEKIYCKEGTKIPHPNERPNSDKYRTFPFDKVTELSHHQAKPNPAVLLEICTSMGVAPEQTAYVGDSLSRDMLMAKDANVRAIYAFYGDNHDQSVIDKLRKLSHWSTAEVNRELELRQKAQLLNPDYRLNERFDEIIIPLGISSFS